MFCEGLGAELVGFERFGVIMFFRKAPPQTEGRRDADPLIKTPPAHSAGLADPAIRGPRP